MTKNFPNLEKEMDIQVQEAQRGPNKMTPERPTPRNTVIKMAKVRDEETILKAARRKLVTHKGSPNGCKLISQQQLYRQKGVVGHF